MSTRLLPCVTSTALQPLIRLGRVPIFNQFQYYSVSLLLKYSHISLLYFLNWVQVSVIGRASRVGAERTAVRIRLEQQILSFPYTLGQTLGPPSPYSIGYHGLLSGGKRPESDVDHYLHLAPKRRLKAAINPLTLRAFVESRGQLSVFILRALRYDKVWAMNSAGGT